MAHFRVSLLLFMAAAFLVWDLTTASSFHGGKCPPKNQVYNDKPCFSDADCWLQGYVCCPNQYNTKSCTRPAPWLKQHYKGKSKFASGKLVKAGVYCEGVKCLPWAVCKLDPGT